MKKLKGEKLDKISTIKKIIFSLIPVFLLFSSVELILYMYHIGTPYKKSPQFNHSFKDLMEKDTYAGIKMKPFASRNDGVKLNSLGFRDDELNKVADFRILCMGDSTTFGFGISDQNLTYSNVLEKLLNSEMEDINNRVTVDVYNTGTPSYTVYQGLQIYIHYLSQLTQWDYVVITYGWNERPDKELDLEYVKHNPPIRSEFLSTLRSLAQNLRIYNVIESSFNKFRFGLSDDPYLQAHKQYRIYFEQFVRLIKGNGSKVIILPVLVNPGDKEGTSLADRMALFNKTTKSIAERDHVVYLDVDKTFSKHKNQIGWFDGFHYDENGHKIIADRLFNFLINNIP